MAVWHNDRGEERENQIHMTISLEYDVSPSIEPVVGAAAPAAVAAPHGLASAVPFPSAAAAAASLFLTLSHIIRAERAVLFEIEKATATMSSTPPTHYRNMLANWKTRHAYGHALHTLANALCSHLLTSRIP